jgi:hypothetical protein
MKNYLRVFVLGILVVGCSTVNKNNAVQIIVENSISTERNSEVIELTKEDLKVTDLSTVGINEMATKKLQITQLVDKDGDGTMDVLLFQPKVKALSSSVYEVVALSDANRPNSELVCYSRFVPERTDDYTWENDKVAFRVYGPVAQQIQESGKPGGTLSSGVDAWLKRVDYPIINKWYKEHFAKISSYHEDAGEGLDNFHVGVSRGVGGIAVRNKGEFYYSKNYTKWRTITTGPLRTSFYLEYETWDAGGKIIKESKIITLDKGSNLSKFETTIEGSNEISAGLTLHEKDGKVSEGKGWVSYWQPHPESEIGTAIVADNNTFSGSEKYDVEKKDLSNAYAHLNVNNNKVTYYAGFAWSKSKQFPTTKSWEAYLDLFSDQINNPLKVKLVN